MTPKEQKAKAILKLLADMKWPTLVPHEHGVHGGLDCHLGSPTQAGTEPVKSTEIYIGRYSALADAIRDWQDPFREAPWCPGDRLDGVCPGLASGIPSDCPKWEKEA